MAPNPDFQRVVEANLAKDAKIVVGCKAGGRSLQAATLMEASGYTSVVDMRGGYHGERDSFGRASVPGWEAEGLPVATTAAPEKTYEALSKVGTGGAPQGSREPSTGFPCRLSESSLPAGSSRWNCLQGDCESVEPGDF